MEHSYGGTSRISKYYRNFNRKLNTTINHWFRHNLKEMSLNVSHATKIKLCLQQPRKTETSELSEDIKKTTTK